MPDEPYDPRSSQSTDGSTNENEETSDPITSSQPTSSSTDNDEEIAKTTPLSKPDNNPTNENKEEQAKEFEKKWKRALADLENYRRQVERDRVELIKFANENTIITLLPVLDNFKRAAEHLPPEFTENEWAKGINAIEKQFEQVLESLGLQKITAEIGKDCNPIQHEMIAIGDGKSGKILEVLEDGYELAGKVLRAVKVRVGK